MAFPPTHHQHNFSIMRNDGGKRACMYGVIEPPTRYEANQFPTISSSLIVSGAAASVHRPDCPIRVSIKPFLLPRFSHKGGLCDRWGLRSTARPSCRVGRSGRPGGKGREGRMDGRRKGRARCDPFPSNCRPPCYALSLWRWR